jgi:hypothetical protein
MNYIKTLLPATIIGFVIPTFTMFYPSLSLPTRQTASIIWQLFPVWIALLNRLFATLVTDTTTRDRIANPTVDMPYLRAAYATSALVAGLAYIYAWSSSSPAAMLAYYASKFSAPPPAGSTIAGLMEYIFVWDQICAFGAAGLWVLLHFYDLKKAGKLAASWARIGAVMGAATVLAGPGAAIALMWWWREEMLARKKVWVG